MCGCTSCPQILLLRPEHVKWFLAEPYRLFLPAPLLNWESEGLNRNQSLQFIFNFFLLSHNWFLSLWSMVQRRAPWPKQLFKCLGWSAPRLSNRTLEADYGSNRMKMFKGWARLLLLSWWGMFTDKSLLYGRTESRREGKVPGHTACLGGQT